MTLYPLGVYNLDGGDIMEGCCLNSGKVKIRSEEDKTNLDVRINKIIGQLNGVKAMIDENRYCDDVLIQLSAIDKSIKSLANIILENH